MIDNDQRFVFYSASEDAMLGDDQNDINEMLPVLEDELAEILADYAALEVGAYPLPWDNLTAPAKARFKHLASRAIRTIDAESAVEDATLAIRELMAWPNLMTNQGPIDIAREAIARFCAIQSRGGDQS
jgi:hypothetical protein